MYMYMHYLHRGESTSTHVNLKLCQLTCVFQKLDRGYKPKTKSYTQQLTTTYIYTLYMYNNNHLQQTHLLNQQLQLSV